ncbi:MAG: FAD:protein FMN transferase [Sedimentisphaerales bacterium]|nr:FAD:protein FMN transferase [Sedimentisphaerales bacterium]
MKNKIGLIVVVAVVGLLGILLYVNAPTRAPVKVDSGYRVIMGTFSRVVVVARNEKAGRACIAAAFKAQRRIESLMSYHRPDSELNKVNRYAAEKAVPVNPMTFEVLQQAVHFSELSCGAFDVTVGPLIDLWRVAGDANEPPSEAALAEARGKVGYDKLILDEKAMTVRFAVEGMRVDLGGIAKGFAIDKSVEAARKGGALGGMVDIGGDIRCFGRPPEGQEHWRIGLQDPTEATEDLATGEPLMILQLLDVAVTTSGDYRRYTTVAGQKQSHIMDAQTGRGAAQLVSVTMIAPDATTADALATAVSVLGQQKGLALIEKLPDVEAILLPAGKDARPIFSAGAGSYVKQ